MINIKFSPMGDEREIPNGKRCLDRTPLTVEEINFLKGEIEAIDADESRFVFNDPDHLFGTCYNFEKDLIYVARNVFPDLDYSTHPRDLLSPRAVLAHEYYGHRPERERYLKEADGEIEPMPDWQDEAYASFSAAFDTPNLSQHDRAMLIVEGRRREMEQSYVIELTEDMREILYGAWPRDTDKGIVHVKGIGVFRSLPGNKGDAYYRKSDCFMPCMREESGR